MPKKSLTKTKMRKKTSNVMNNNLYTRLILFINSLSGSKLLAGISLIIMNIGSKYINISFNKSTEAFFKYILSKQIFIFTICWVATKDLWVSLFLSTLFYILTEHLLNDNSKFCIISKHKFNKIYKSIDMNNDGKISDKEIQHAIKILQKHNEKNSK
jgi:hypothetical protein